MSTKKQSLAHDLELLCDIALKALFAKWFESQLKNFDGMKFRKRLWLLYLLATGLETALSMFVAYVQHQSANNASYWSRTAVCFGCFIQTSGCGVNRPLWALAYNCKKLHEFFIKFFCYLFEMSNNQNR